MASKVELIKTDRALKDMLRWQLAHFLASDAPDCYEYLRNIVVVLRGYENIRNAMDEELGENKDKILKAALEDYPVYWKTMLELRGMIKVANENSNAKLAQFIDMKVRLYMTKVTFLHDSLLRCWIAGIKRTDLVLQYTPSDQVLAATKQNLSYKSPLRRPEDMGAGE